MPVWFLAGFWGFVAGSALLIGAVIGYLAALPRRLIAAVMAFGSGVLISALSFDLMDEAYRRGGFDSTAAGFLAGAAVYTAANWFLSRHGAKHRKRSGTQQPSESDDSGSGTAIAVGALLDGIPESMVIGLSLLHGGAVFDYYFGIPASLDMDPYVYIENNRTVEQPASRTPGRNEPRGVFWRAGAMAPSFRFEEVLPALTGKAVGYLRGRAKSPGT